MTKKVDKRDEQIAELTADLQRAHADLINYQRRAEEEKGKLADFAKAMVIKQLLPLLDNLERALTNLPKELAKNDWAKGVATTGKQVQEALTKLGAVRIKTVGEPFDPHLHEAVSVEGDSGDEVISEELQAGYALGDEIIRHAVVKVKRGKHVVS